MIQGDSILNEELLLLEWTRKNKKDKSECDGVITHREPSKPLITTRPSESTRPPEPVVSSETHSPGIEGEKNRDALSVLGL